MSSTKNDQAEEMKERKRNGLMEMTHLWKSTQNVDFHKLLGKAPPKNGGPFPHFHRPYEVSISKGRIHLKQAHFLSSQWGTPQ
jgi:hypothetical protein